jgi:hypothetical protein
MSEAHSKASRTISIIAFLWLALALVVGWLRLLEPVPRIVNQFILFALTAGLLIAFFKSDSFHDRMLALPLRALILFHAIRFVGVYFLWLWRRGELPFAFAVPGGSGDITVAATALLVGTLFKANRRVVLGWNIFGMIDILFVVATAARLGLSNPASMLALTHLPLSLLPTFIVPLIIFTHIVIFYRLGKQPRQNSPDLH